jgi:hypothetical protein
MINPENEEASSKPQQEEDSNNSTSKEKLGICKGPFTPRQEILRKRLIKEAAAPGVLRWNDEE